MESALLNRTNCKFKSVGWLKKNVGQAQNVVPVVIKLNDRGLSSHQKELSIKVSIIWGLSSIQFSRSVMSDSLWSHESQHARLKEGLKSIIENLKEQGLLIACNSPCNTPILGVKKSNDKWRLVQDVWIINEAVVPFAYMPKTNGFSCLQVWVDTYCMDWGLPLP